MLGLGAYGSYTALKFKVDNNRASELLRQSRPDQAYNFDDVEEIEVRQRV